MNHLTYPQFNKRKDADLIICPFWEDRDVYPGASISSGFLDKINNPLQVGDFKGKEGEISLVYLESEKESRCLLLGLGKQEKLSVDALRRAYASAIRFCHRKKIKRINILIPDSKAILLEESDLIKGISEGIFLTNYKWDQLKSQKQDSISLIEQIGWIGATNKILALVKKFENVSEAVYFARDLINGNADDVTPEFLAQTAKKLSSKFKKIKTTVLNQAEIEKLGMGLLLAVGRGSSHEPAFITMHYNGNPRSKNHTVLVGKGVTFDTGGLNIKPTGSMETMRDDMSGAAAVMGAIVAAAAIDLKVNVTAVVAAAENAIDAKSFKPGDVYTSYNGKTIEIGNTDAEGRLTLADALGYAVDKLAPTRIIDLATLTGAMVIALGEEISGLMSNDDTLASQLLTASESTSELLWRLPLHCPYKDTLRSEVADLKNIGGRPAGSLIAGLFLQEFVKEIPWAHIDIAGTAFGSKERHYLPKNGVGFGVRLLIDFLERFG